MKILEAKEKSLLTHKRKAYTPSVDERKKVMDAMSGIENLDGFGFYKAIVADTRLDRHRDVLTRGFLEILAKKYDEGRAVVDSHSERKSVGYTFASEVVPDASDPTHFQLIVKFYISPDAVLFSGTKAKTALDQALVRRTSVSFSASEFKYVASDATENVHGVGYYVYDVPTNSSEDNIEVFEVSLVMMGVQAGAKIKELVSQKEGINKKDTLPQNSKKMKYLIKSLDRSIDVEQTVIDSIELLEAKIKSLNDSLKVFKDREEKKKKVLITELVNLRCKAFKNLNAESETLKFSAFDIDSLISEITLTKSMKPKDHVQITPNPTGVNSNNSSDLPSFID